MSTETLCWQCSKPYNIAAEQCPHCGATNGNHAFERAEQEARMDCLPVPTDRHQGWPGVYAVLYTDSINDEQTSRDDLWMATTKAIDAIQTTSYAEGRKDEAEDNMEMLSWAYGKLHHVAFTKMDDALMLDRIKLLLEHGAMS